MRLLDVVDVESGAAAGMGLGDDEGEGFAGLVTACRFCGLLDASAAAHEQARQLDPTISTSAQHTYWMMGEYERALAAVDPERDVGGDEAFIHESMGNIPRALEVLAQRGGALSQKTRSATIGLEIVDAFRSAILRSVDGAPEIFERYIDFPDPEGRFHMGRCLARLGNTDRALDALSRAEEGFFCYPFFMRDPWLDVLRADERFVAILRRAETRYHDALRAFEQHPGSRLLGVGLRR